MRTHDDESRDRCGRMSQVLIGHVDRDDLAFPVAEIDGPPAGRDCRATDLEVRFRFEHGFRLLLLWYRIEQRQSAIAVALPLTLVDCDGVVSIDQRRCGVEAHAAERADGQCDVERLADAELRAQFVEDDAGDRERCEFGWWRFGGLCRGEGRRIAVREVFRHDASMVRWRIFAVRCTEKIIGNTADYQI